MLGWEFLANGTLGRARSTLFRNIAFAVLISTTSAVCAQGGFKVGDKVEFQLHGKTNVGEIIRFTGTGWPVVKYDLRGRQAQWMQPANKFTLVKGTSPSSDAPPAEMREWVDATGKFKIQAKLLSNKGGTVELEKSDGRIIKLPVSKLSSNDKKYLQDLETQSDPANPFAGGEMRDRGASRSTRSGSNKKTGPASAAATVAAVKPDLTLNQQVLGGGNWEYQAIAAEEKKVNRRVVTLNTTLTSNPVHHRLAGARFSQDKKFLATARTCPFDKATEVFLVDLEAGFASQAQRVAGKDRTLVAVSPNASYFVTRKKDFGSTPGSLDFWKVGSPPKHVASWTTAGFADRTGFKPSKVRFVGTDQIVTVGRHLALWDLGSAAAVYSIPLTSSTANAFSPTGGDVAIATGTSIQLVNVLSGSSIGQFDAPTSATNALAFSQSGQFLAGQYSTDGSIWIWDLESNELAQELGGATGSGMRWVGDRYLLVGGALIDVELRVPVWSYTSSGGSILDANDGRFWFAAKSKIVPIQLPHRNLDSQTAKYDPDELLILKPGEQVAFDFQLPFTPDQQRDIRDKITKGLQSNQVSVNQGASIRLVARVKRLKQEQQRMSDFRDPFGRRSGQDVTYTPHYGEIYLEKDGKKLWSRGRRFGPAGIVSVNRGESAQQAVTRVSQPNPSFFSTIRLPKYLASLPGGQPLGKSTINESGVN